MGTNPIEQLLENSKTDLERAKEYMEEKRHQYQVAENRLSAAQAAYDAFLASHALIENGAKKPKRKRSPKGPSTASPETKRLFTAIYAQHADSEFGYEDIQHVADRNGVVINMVNVRSNMSDYVRGGYFERPSPGRFVMQDSGKAFFGISIFSPARAPAPLPSSQDEKTGMSIDFSRLQDAMARAEARRKRDNER